MTNGKSLSVGLCLVGIAASTNLQAYELATHARLTHEAFNQSVLNGSEFLKSIGIDSVVMNQSGSFALNPFGDSYYDVSGNTVNLRQADPNGVQFDVRFMGLSDPEQRFTLPAWLMRGAIREDDVLYPDNGQPVDDPYNSNDAVRDNRVLHHFYDPVNDQGLSRWIPLSWIGVKKAPNWAIGSEDAISNQNGPEPYRRNHFTVFDAREAMYRALTGKGRNALGDEFDAAPSKTERDKYWATLFRALGDIVHLVEDMAQPQHTRNDPHAGKKYDGSSGLLGHKSAYESYVEARATGGTFEVPGVFTIAANGLTYDGYPMPRFTDYLSYFTTRHKHPDPNQITVRQGLADYSNRGFFSAGTNIESENNVYVLPDRNLAAYIPTDLYVDWQGEPLGSDPNAQVTILQGSVPDSLPGGYTATDIPLATYGAWDIFLRPKGKTDYSLNRYNYDAMADLLIPRAVAYSAGIIDYFFRGRFEAEAHCVGAAIRSFA